MFGMGGTEIIVILIVALLFLGPDKLPDAAKKISKGIRDIKKQSRVLQQTIEDDEHIGGAIRDLKSALRGDDEPVRPKPIRALKPKQIETVVATAATAALPEPTEDEHPHVAAADAVKDDAAKDDAAHATADHPPEAARPALSMSPTAGEADAPHPTAHDDAELAALVKPAPNTIARSTPAPSIAAPAVPATPATSEPAAAADMSEPKHG
jgi:sec-independent protein translocase protein TatB